MRRNEIARAMMTLGLTPRHKGFHYLGTAFLNVSGGVTPERAIGIAAAEKGEDPKRLDRCMRYAISYAWDVGNGGIRGLFPGYGAPPSPTELLYVLFWKLDDEIGIKKPEPNEDGSDEKSTYQTRKSL